MMHSPSIKQQGISPLIHKRIQCLTLNLCILKTLCPIQLWDGVGNCTQSSMANRIAFQCFTPHFQ